MNLTLASAETDYEHLQNGQYVSYRTEPRKTMKLLRAEIRNFRSIKSVDIAFDPKCRVLVGINESGKSNVLKALALLDPGRATSPRDVRMEANDETPPKDTLVRFVFALSAEEQTEILKATQEHFLEPDQHELLVGTTQNLNLTLQEFIAKRNERLYKVDLKDGSRSHTVWSAPSGWKILSGWRITKGQTVLRHSTWADDVTVGAGKWFFAKNYEAITGDEPETPDLAALVTLLNRVGKPTSERELPKCIYWEYREQDLLPNTVSIDDFASNPQSCIPLANMFALTDIQSGDIQSAINAARSRGTVFYQRLLEKIGDRTTTYLRKVWQDHATISVQLLPNGPLVEPVVRDLEIPLDFGSRSDGFKRMINFLLHVSVAVTNDAIENSLILIDEPEIGLHPKGARNLASELFRLSKKNVIVFATHSIFMVDRERIDRHIIVKKVKETTTTDNAGNAAILDEEVLYQALGWSFREILPPSNVVFEGWRDKQLFSAWTKRTGKTKTGAAPDQIGLTHAVGVKDVSNVCRQLELAQRDCLVMSDCDKPALEWKKRHESERIHGTWKTYDDVFDDQVHLTGEDFLAAKSLFQRCNSFASEKGFQPPKVDEILQRPRWPKLAAWIATCSNGDKELLRLLEHGLKSALFEGLSKQDIDSDYEKVHAFILHHFESIQTV